MENNEFYQQFPSVDDAAKSFMATKHFQGLSTADRQTALDKMRSEYRVAHVANKTPSRGSVDGHVEPAKTPVESEPAPQPDLASRIRGGAMRATETTGSIMDPSYGNIGQHLKGELHALSSLLPDDNAQAFIDSAMLGTMFTGAGEMGLAARLAIPTVAGAAGGATEGSPSAAAYGGLKGGAEALGGEAIALPFRAAKGAYGWMTRGAKKLAMQSGDLARLSDWLGERFPKSVATIKDMGDFVKTFRQGVLVKHADGEMTRLNGEATDALAKAQKPSAAGEVGPAEIKSPAGQDIEQDQALSEVREKGPFGKAATGSSSPAAPEPHTLRPEDVADAPKRLANAERALADAKAKGQGSRVIDGLQEQVNQLRKSVPSTPEERLAQMRQGAIGTSPTERATYLFDEPGAPPKPISSGPKYTAEGTAPKSPRPTREPIINPQPKSHGPTISSQGMPQAVADKLEIPRNAKVEVPFKVATNLLNDIEDRGWDLSGHAIHTRKGAAARASAMQMEQYIGDQLAKTDAKVASSWLEGRQNQRTARVLTKLFNDKDVIDETGHLAMDKVHEIAKQGDMFADLEAAMGSDEAVRFLTNPETGGGLFRGAPPTANDIPGKGVTGTVSLHPGLPPHPRAWIHPPKAATYVGLNGAPYQMGYGRALTAALVLGPERFIQMMGDLANSGDMTDASNAR